MLAVLELSLSVQQANLRFKDLSASASQTLRLKACTTSALQKFFFFKFYFYFVHMGFLPACMLICKVHAVLMKARRGFWIL